MLIRSWLFESPRWYAAYDVLLLEAEIDGTVDLKHSKARVWFDSSSWRYFLKKLENEQMIVLTDTQSGRLINYEKYASLHLEEN